MQKLFFVLLALWTGAASASTELTAAIEKVRSTCGGISDQLADMKKMAGINREYRDKLGFFTDQKGNKQIAYEIEILKAAYFCQQAVFWRFCLWPLEENTAIVDEIVDAQKTIVRELYTEIKKRNSVM